jgi:hypothetical protein
MDHVIRSVAAFDRRAERTGSRRQLNWGLLLALGVNCVMWAGIIQLVQHLHA